MGSYSENCPPSVVVTASLSSSSTPPQIRSLEKTLEEAVSLGALRLSGRKLKEISSKLFQKYDLSDTIVADLSKNRLSELPAFVCEFYLLSELSLYSNLLRCLPSDGSLLTLQNLTYLNLSKNQVSVIPQALCELPKLQVLIVSHNRLCSLPEELGHMASLSDLDVSCNEISFLPSQIGDLVSLKYLDLRRNLLVELPPDICELQGLRRLDISENRIQTLPSQMKHMALTEFFCDHNPLVTPPAALCTRGLIHVKKFLDNEDRKRGGSAQSDSGTLTNGRSGLRQRESLRLTNLGCYGNSGKNKIESSLIDGVSSFGFNEKGYQINSFKDDMNATDEIRRFAAQRMEFTRSPKKAQPQEQALITSPSSEANTLQGGLATPSTLSPTTEFAPLPNNDLMKPVGLDGTGATLTPEEEFRQRHEAIVMKQRAEALKRAQKDAVMAFVKQRTNSVTLPPHPQQPPPPPPGAVTNLPATASPTAETAPPLPNFTIRRGLDRAREEQELLHRMRQIIESRLKMALPENLAGALTDGVVLCHLANNVRPRSVATIHVPSPATPKLTMAKCRRNVENFLDACRRLGVPSEEICECGDVLAEFDAQAVLSTIEGLLKIAKAKPKCRPPPPPPARDGQQAQIVNNNISKILKDEVDQLQTSESGENGPPFNAEAISRNDSPVSTSEDISNLENLEFDTSDIRASSTSGNQQRVKLDSCDHEDEVGNVTTTFQSVHSRQDRDGTAVTRLRNMFEAAAPKLQEADFKASPETADLRNSPAIDGAETAQSNSVVSKPKIFAAAAAGAGVLYMYFYHPWILLSLFIGLIIAAFRIFTQRDTT